MIHQAMQDPSPSIKIIGLDCMNSIKVSFGMNETFSSHFIQLIPQVISIMQHGIQVDDDRIAAGFEIIDFLAEEHVDYIKEMILDLCKFMLSVSVNSNIDNTFRQKAIYFLDFIISYKGKTFLKTNLLHDTLNVSFSICSEPYDDDDENDNDNYDDLKMKKFGEELISSIGNHIPPLIFGVLYKVK